MPAKAPSGRSAGSATKKKATTKNVAPKKTVAKKPAPAEAPRPAARALDAEKVFGSGATAVRALDGVTVEFPSGRYSAIMGPSGSGKYTLMHCVAGLDTLTSGKVFIGDVDLSTLSDKELTLLRRDRVGFVFQALNLVP